MQSITTRLQTMTSFTRSSPRKHLHGIVVFGTLFLLLVATYAYFGQIYRDFGVGLFHSHPLSIRILTRSVNSASEETKPLIPMEYQENSSKATPTLQQSSHTKRTHRSVEHSLLRGQRRKMRSGLRKSWEVSRAST